MVAKVVAEYAVKNDKSSFGQIFCRRNTFENDGFVAGQRFQEFDDGRIACINEKSMIPVVDQMPFCQRLDVGKIHHHTVGCIAVMADDVAGQGDFENVTMTVKMTAMAFVIGDTVASVKLQAASDEHGEIRRKNQRADYIGIAMTVFESACDL